MRLLHYNILNGFEGRPDRIGAFTDYLSKQSYDLLALNEYRLEDHGLRRQLETIGYCHQIVNTTALPANRSAFFSRHPFEPLSVDKALRLVRIGIDGLELVSYHASPHGVEAVLQEADRLLSLLRESRNVVVMGDFNSLSRRDEARFRYNPSTIRPRYLHAGTVSYDFIERLESHHFVDLDDDGSSDNRSIPTAIARPEEHDQPARLDYAFARFDENHGGTSRVLREPCFDLLSDHYPVAISIDGPTVRA